MELASALLERLEGDVVASPYSLARALDIVRAGATGETRKALDDVLGDPTPEIEGVELAQAAWLAPEYEPGPALEKLDTGPLDAQAVNAWAAEKTHGMIQRIIDRFGPDEQLAITDAIYFEGKWAHPFEVLGTRPFGDGQECTMMTVTGGFEHAGEEAVRLPYGHGDLRFVASLGGLHGLQWHHGDGTVELPRFSAESMLDLNKVLPELAPAFIPGGELENLFTGPGAKSLSRILQRARVDLDEHGTKAAAVTAVMARAVSYTPPFHIVFDRPFTWAIEHAPSGTPLFVGRVLNPTERSD